MDTKANKTKTWFRHLLCNPMRKWSRLFYSCDKVHKILMVLKVLDLACTVLYKLRRLQKTQLMSKNSYVSQLLH